MSQPPNKYSQFHDEFDNVNKSLFFSRVQPFQTAMPLPRQTKANTDEKPFSFVDPVPHDAKEVYDPRFHIYYTMSLQNKGNIIYIRRDSLGKNKRT